jgi:Flp pilus assembly protein TadB
LWLAFSCRVIAPGNQHSSTLLRWGLADALDLMVVSVEAGLGLNAAMMKSVQS